MMPLFYTGQTEIIKDLEKVKLVTYPYEKHGGYTIAVNPGERGMNLEICDLAKSLGIKTWDDYKKALPVMKAFAEEMERRFNGYLELEEKLKIANQTIASIQTPEAKREWIVFNLTHHWFDEIAYNGKRIEYREVKPYWTKRLQGKVGATVEFRRGYNSHTHLLGDITKIDTGSCPYPEWDKEYYRIYFTLNTGLDGKKWEGE